MNLIASATAVVERAPLPDALTRFGIARLIGRTNRQLDVSDCNAVIAFTQDMATRPIAEFAQTANEQHYELPPRFFELVLGVHRKYSCCLFNGAVTLDEAEAAALTATAHNADLADGQNILELGCGWGALSLWMAEQFPNAHITAVSNSTAQRASIEARACDRGLVNLDVVTCDMNLYEPAGAYDRIVSVEMFEHMANWSALLERARRWLAPKGRVFLHVFSHRSRPYRFDHTDPSDWIARYFFTGGIMPSHDLLNYIPMPFEIEAAWRWDGRHYARTARAWLANMDRHDREIMEIMRQVYGAEGRVWYRRWRLFFLATAGLFGHDSGEVWGVSHYRLAPRDA